MDAGVEADGAGVEVQEAEPAVEPGRSANTPLNAVFGSTFPTPLNAPTAENVSGCVSPIRSACPAPIDSPAITRLSRSGTVR